jgi:hypothetical protein
MFVTVIDYYFHTDITLHIVHCLRHVSYTWTLFLLHVMYEPVGKICMLSSDLSAWIVRNECYI